MAELKRSAEDMKRFAILLIGLLLIGCSAPRKDAKEAESVGVAEMKADRTIVLRLRSEEPDGLLAEGYFEYAPSHPDYEKILEHVGHLEPGKSVSVKPWPDEEGPNQTPQTTPVSAPR